MLKNLRFSYRLSVIVGFFSLIIISALTINNYLLLKNEIKGNVRSELKVSNELTYNLIKGSVDVSIQNYLRGIAEANINILEYYHQKWQNGELTEEEAKESAKQASLTFKIGKSGYIYYLNSKGIIKSHPKEELLNADLTKHEFIQEQMRKKHGYIEYLWKNPGETAERHKSLYMIYFEPWDYIVSVSSYRNEFHELININDFATPINEIKIKDTGYVYIMNSKGDLIIHPQMQGQNIYNSRDENGNYFVQKICTEKNGEIIYPWKNPADKQLHNKIARYKYFEEMDWIIVSGIYLNELYAPVRILLKEVILISVIIFVVFIIISFFIGRAIGKPLERLQATASAIGNGELTHSVNYHSRSEIGKLAKSIDEMQVKLSDLIRRIGKNVEILETASKNLDDVSKEMNESTQSMSDKSNHVAGATEQMSQNVNTIASTAEEMSMNISMVASAAEEISHSMKHLTKSMDDLNHAMDNIEQNSQNVTNVAGNAMKRSKLATTAMETLRVSANEIGEVTHVIKQIAQKTNLLALNAKIEAASAGEAGKGFEVVANEIKELANQSAKATEKIASKVESVQINTTEAIEVINAVSQFIVKIHNAEEEINQAVVNQNQSMDAIAANIKETNNGIQNIAKSVQELTVGSADLSKNAGEAAKATNHVAENIMHVNEDLFRNKNNAENIKKSANNVLESARKLIELVSKFKI